MDFRKLTSEASKKLKDARHYGRRTAQKMVESLRGVAELSPEDLRCVQMYDDYMWLGEYLRALRERLTHANRKLTDAIQANFELAAQCESMLSVSGTADDEPTEESGVGARRALPSVLEKLYAKDPSSGQGAVSRQSVVVGSARKMFSAQAMVNGEPIRDYDDSCQEHIGVSISKELDQNDAMTKMLYDEREDARLDYSSCRRRMETDKSGKWSTKCDEAKAALDEATEEFQTHLEARLEQRARLVTSTLALIVQLQSRFWSDYAAALENLAGEVLPYLQLCQMESKVVDVKKAKAAKKGAKKANKKTASAKGDTKTPAVKVSGGGGGSSSGADKSAASPASSSKEASVLEQLGLSPRAESPSSGNAQDNLLDLGGSTEVSNGGGSGGQAAPSSGMDSLLGLDFSAPADSPGLHRRAKSVGDGGTSAKKSDLDAMMADMASFGGTSVSKTKSSSTDAMPFNLSTSQSARAPSTSGGSGLGLDEIFGGASTSSSAAAGAYGNAQKPTANIFGMGGGGGNTSSIEAD